MTDLVETVARAMARRIIEREASKVTSRGLPEDVMQRSIDRVWGRWCADDARTAIEAIEAAGYRIVPK